MHGKPELCIQLRSFTRARCCFIQLYRVWRWVQWQYLFSVTKFVKATQNCSNGKPTRMIAQRFTCALMGIHCGINVHRTAWSMPTASRVSLQDLLLINVSNYSHVALRSAVIHELDSQSEGIGFVLRCRPDFQRSL